MAPLARHIAPEAKRPAPEIMLSGSIAVIRTLKVLQFPIFNPMSPQMAHHAYCLTVAAHWIQRRATIDGSRAERCQVSPPEELE